MILYGFSIQGKSHMIKKPFVRIQIRQDACVPVIILVLWQMVLEVHLIQT